MMASAKVTEDRQHGGGTPPNQFWIQERGRKGKRYGIDTRNGNIIVGVIGYKSGLRRMTVA